MKAQSDKMLESVRYILQNIDISSFRAEFNLETKQVKVELLAEFESFAEGIEHLQFGTDPRSDSEKITFEKKRCDFIKQISGAEPQDDSEISESDESMENDDRGNAMTKNTPEISDGGDELLSSGFTPSERKKGKFQHETLKINR